MTHIHQLIDFTADVYVVFDDKILFIYHKALKKWLPVGGHIELNEDPNEALLREVKEESGLEIEIIGSKPYFENQDVKSLYPPVFLNIHKISETHRHVGMTYFAKAKTDKVMLAKDEHEEIKWLTGNDLEDPKYNLQEDVKYYAKEALKRVV